MTYLLMVWSTFLFSLNEHFRGGWLMKKMYDCNLVITTLKYSVTFNNNYEPSLISKKNFGLCICKIV